MLVTCATYNYSQMLTLLLASHEYSNPGIPLHVHAINWPSSALNQMRSMYPCAVFHDHHDTQQNGPQELTGPVPRTANILKLKVEVFFKAYQECKESVVWVDADTLLLASIEPMLQRVGNEGDFGVTYRRRKRDHAKFAVAVLCFTKSKAAARLLERYVHEVRTSQGLVKRKSKDGAAWFHDQLGLWYAYRALSRNRIGFPRPGAPKLVALSDEEHSIDGNIEAVFVARRPRVFSLEQMENELTRRGVRVRTLGS